MIDHKNALECCHEIALNSKDPNTKVGCVIVKDGEIVSSGWNRFPNGVVQDDRIHDRDTKLSLIVHAEMAAILSAAKKGISLQGSTLYVLVIDAKTGNIWGGGPCLRCTVEIIEAGISKIVSIPFKDGNSNWKCSIEKSREILKEAGVEYIEIPSLDFTL